MISNLDHFVAIAEAAWERSDRFYKRHFTPLPGGRGVHRLDPKSRSMRHSLVAIVFAGVALEALVYAYLRETESKRQAKLMDNRSYRTRLRRIGIRDAALLDCADRLQAARKDIVHERALVTTDPGDMRRFGPPRVAQEEAREAVRCLRAVRQHVAAQLDHNGKA